MNVDGGLNFPKFDQEVTRLGKTRLGETRLGKTRMEDENGKRVSFVKSPP